MKLIGLMPVRNEAWCLGLTLRAALRWCDIVICADHGSTDNSREIMEQIADETKRVVIRDDREPEWREMEQRQMLLNEARECGATHIAIVDADEIVTGNLLTDQGTRGQKPPWMWPKYSSNPLWIRPLVEAVPKGSILQLPMYQLRGSLDRYHANGIWGNRWLSVAFQDDPKLSWSGDKFHSREPQGMTLKPYRPIAHGQGGSLHLWGVSERRLRAKHALYKVTERLRWPKKGGIDIDRMYNLWRSPQDSVDAGYGLGATWTFADVPAEWWRPYNRTLIHDDDYKAGTTLWQEAEVKRLVAQHGAETFAGLDLFGVA